MSAPDLDVYGATLFGVPVIMQGHNQCIAWGLTPNAPDFGDIYFEKLGHRRQGPFAQFNSNGISNNDFSDLFLALQVKQVPYKVKTSHGMETRTASYLQGPIGPVVYMGGDTIYTFKIGGYSRWGAVRQFYEMGQAQNLDDFQDALSFQQLPCFHILYADCSGNIFYRYNAIVGRKHIFDHPEPPSFTGETNRSVSKQKGSKKNTSSHRPVIDWTHPLPVKDNLYRWGRIISPDRLPSVLNPPSGYLQCCGCPPSEVPNESWPDLEVPSWLGTDRYTYRARRIRHLLATGPKSFADMQTMAYDILSPLATSAIPELERLLENTGNQQEYPVHPELQKAVELLKHWNCTYSQDAEGAVFFDAWWQAIRKRTPDISSFTDRMDAFLDGYLPPEVILQAGDDAVRFMRNTFHSLAVPWNRIHRLKRGTQDIAVPGGNLGDSVLVERGEGNREGLQNINYGYAFGMIVKFSNPITAVSMVPFGSSERPHSSHYTDQLSLLANRQFKYTHFNWKDIQTHMESADGKSVTWYIPEMQGKFVFHSNSKLHVLVKTALKPPSPLPTGKYIYSLFMYTNVIPDSDCTVDMEIKIPDNLCPLEYFKQLSILRFQDNVGWQSVLRLKRNVTERTLTGHDVHGGVYAVVGPYLDTLHRGAVESSGRGDLFGKDQERNVNKNHESTFIPGEYGSEKISHSFAKKKESPGERECKDHRKQGNKLSQTPSSLIAWGENISLSSPDKKIDISVQATRIVGLQIKILASPPAQLPATYKAWGSFYWVKCSNLQFVREIRIVLKIPFHTFDVTYPPVLLHYNYTAGKWESVSDQVFDEDTGTISTRKKENGVYVIVTP